MFLPNNNSQRSGFFQIFSSLFIYLDWFSDIQHCVDVLVAYSVKDRDCKNVPELGHSHVMELRMMLGLY